MRILQLGLLVALFAGAPTWAAPEPGLYNIDTAHSSVTFSVGHSQVARVSGRLDGLSGSFFVGEAEISDVVANIDPTTVYTGHAKRDEHLRKDDFFGVDDHPSIDFRATRIERLADERFAVTGELTMLGISRPVSFQAREIASKSGSYQGKTFHMVGFTGSGTLQRSDFGMDFGLGMIGDEVAFDVFIEAVYIEENPQEAP